MPGVYPAFCSIGNFSKFSYRTKTFRGMRTARIREMAADAHFLEIKSGVKWDGRL